MAEQRIDISPGIIEQIEAMPHKESYWTLGGTIKQPKRGLWSRSTPRNPVSALWTSLYYSKEDAEANYDDGDTCWVWDGRPAFQIKLSDAMFNARKDGRLGVRVESWIDGKWVVVKRYPANEPLPEATT